MPEKMTTERVDELMREVFHELNRRDGKARGTAVMAAIAERVQLTDYERALTKTGAVRWDVTLRFNTTDCVRAGYIRKGGGNWTLTDEGRQALQLPAGELIREARRRYNRWKKQQDAENGSDLHDPVAAGDDAPDQPLNESEAATRAALEQAQEQARQGIEQALWDLGPYDFQNFCEVLLQAMGYHVVFNAPPGPDGGVDLIAYQDPLGIKTPRIKIQVKHHKNKMSVKEVRELQGILRRSDEMGLLIASGGFTSEAEREARQSHVHLELMEMDRIIDLWERHYDKVSEEGKTMLPLVRVSFLATAND